MTLQTPRSFNSWLRGQLKEKKMSQRQLALQSGVDHSTISRLIKGDRMSMASSVEARVPFLDPALVDYVYRLPLDLKLKNGVTKIDQPRL